MSKIALVIGNSNYGEDDVSGRQDAILMNTALKQLGFTWTKQVPDGDLVTIRAALKDFKDQMDGASVVVFFYSGHGFQLDRKNYLYPIDGTLDSLGSLSLDEVQVVLGFASNTAVKLVILDACRTEKGLPDGAPQGFDQEQAPPLPGSLYAFAAGPNLVAASGKPDGTSPYTAALLRHIREPGLSLGDLFGTVLAELMKVGQSPAFLNNGVPLGFFLRDPVTVNARVDQADDDLILVLPGGIALDANDQKEKVLTLKSGDNPISLLVFNEKTFHNGQSWEKTEGWEYDLKVTLPDGSVVPFTDSEDVVFKDGPHHGSCSK
ncbi:MAG TPA: caspase family protein [Thermoanaerobaculia bacterium]|jgi:hypothetical protein|nr:caspase family protein [Thermoanaerobaculia bacterium]